MATAVLSEAHFDREVLDYALAALVDAEEDDDDSVDALVELLAASCDTAAAGCARNGVRRSEREHTRKQARAASAAG